MNVDTLTRNKRIGKVDDVATNVSDQRGAFILYNLENRTGKPISRLCSSTRFSNSERFSLEQLKNNKRKLRAIKKLPSNWNNYGAEIFEETLITRTEKIISDLDYQPQIFPTGRGSIQIEKYINEDNFVEIEVSLDKIFAYQMKGGKEVEKEISADEINELISELYA